MNALDGFKTKRYQFGSNTYILDKVAMTYILKRHHPEYWDGSIKSTQSFYAQIYQLSKLKQKLEMFYRRIMKN